MKIFGRFFITSSKSSKKSNFPCEEGDINITIEEEEGSQQQQLQLQLPQQQNDDGATTAKKKKAILPPGVFGVDQRNHDDDDCDVEGEGERRRSSTVTARTTRMSSMSMMMSSRMIDMSGAISASDNSSSSSTDDNGSNNESSTGSGSGSDGDSSCEREKRPCLLQSKTTSLPTTKSSSSSSSSMSMSEGQGQEMILVEKDDSYFNVKRMMRRLLLQQRRKRRLLFVLLGVIILLLLIVVAPSVITSNNNKQQQQSSAATAATTSTSTTGGGADAKGDGNDDDDDTFEPYYSTSSSSSSSFFTSKYRQVPFSILDPVNDLGLVPQGFQRPEQFMPSKRIQTTTTTTSDPSTQQQPQSQSQSQSQQQSQQQPIKPLPTNTWYQNLLGLKQDEQPTPSHKVYTVPYLIDVVLATTMGGEVVVPVEQGLRVHPTRLTADTTQVSVTVDEPYALHIGLGGRRRTTSPVESTSTTPNTTTTTTTTANNDYQVVATTELSLTLQWNNNQKQQQQVQTSTNAPSRPTMTTTLTRGMPYVTMIYDLDQDQFSSDEKNSADAAAAGDDDELLLIPTMFIGSPLIELPTIDQQTPTVGSNFCDSYSTTNDGVIIVESEFEFSIQNGNKPQRWMVFVSRPVELSCQIGQEGGTTTFQMKPQPTTVVPSAGEQGTATSYTSSSSPSPSSFPQKLVVRAALVVDDVVATAAASSSSSSNGGADGGVESTGTTFDEASLTASMASTVASSTSFEDGYKSLLRSGANIYPGTNPTVDFAFNNNNNNNLEDNNGIAAAAAAGEGADYTSSQATPSRSRITFDWNPQYMKDDMTDGQEGDGNNNNNNNEKMIMFALPHHQDVLRTTSGGGQQLLSNMCTLSLLGKACLVQSPVLSLTLPDEQNEVTSTSTTSISVSRWEMFEDLPPVQLRAQRPPQPRLLPALAEALMDDIDYQIPRNFQIGAGDTYFSGKTIARLARILLIDEELQELCGTATINEEYEAVCTQIDLPSNEQSQSALDQLRRVMTVWMRDNQQAPFVYDTTWGGTVSCGCLYSGGVCTNAPSSTASEGLNCPSFTDKGLNFGNGVYNDHHFHYGYFVYSAAVLSHFDSQWGIENFENVLLLIRDYANPSHNDKSYPVFRNKDWYKGHSWAAGLVDPVFVNINNQESSSEAIAAYEAVALYGQVMSKNFKSVGGDVATAGNESDVANNIHRIGLVLTATELRSTRKYWQIYDDDGDDGTYPAQPYNAGVVGILWETMIQFTTWFGNSPYLIYGIQLLPITPISEQRDSPKWAEAIYARLSQSCDSRCVSEGWSVQIFALLAILGKIDEAIELTNALNPSVYVGPGGNGHSRSNTIWYIATRPQLSSDNSSPPVVGAGDGLPDFPAFEFTEITCGQPESSTCTETALDSLAGDYSCRSRIEWLINNEGLTETASCSRVAGEFAQCQACNPSSSSSSSFGANSGLNNNADDEGSDLDQGNEEVRTQEPSVESSNGDGNNISTTSLTCFQPARCTTAVLNRMAGGFTCKDRIEYLIDTQGQSETKACQQVSSVEFPNECGPCTPPTTSTQSGSGTGTTGSGSGRRRARKLLRGSY